MNNTNWSKVTMIVSCTIIRYGTSRRGRSYMLATASLKIPIRRPVLILKTTATGIFKRIKKEEEAETNNGRRKEEEETDVVFEHNGGEIERGAGGTVGGACREEDC